MRMFLRNLLGALARKPRNYAELYGAVVTALADGRLGDVERLLWSLDLAHLYGLIEVCEVVQGQAEAEKRTREYRANSQQ